MGRVPNEELFAEKLHVNLSAFIYRLFHEDFSPIYGIFSLNHLPVSYTSALSYYYTLGDYIQISRGQ